MSMGIGLSRIGIHPHLVVRGRNMGRLQAVNLKRLQLVWGFRQSTPIVSTVLATGESWCLWLILSRL